MYTQNTCGIRLDWPIELNITKLWMFPTLNPNVRFYSSTAHTRGGPFFFEYYTPFASAENNYTESRFRG